MEGGGGTVLQRHSRTLTPSSPVQYYSALYMEGRLRLIEEVVCGPQASGTSAPGMEEVEGATLADDMKAELRV